MKRLIMILCLGLAGCATSPVAWRDLGDGEGMRGWAGIPLKYSVPAALAAQNMRSQYQPAYQTQYQYAPPNWPKPLEVNPLGSVGNPVYIKPAPGLIPIGQ